MFLQIWPNQTTRQPIVKGELVFVRLGEVLLLRGDVVHGGGFSSSRENGNPRCHIYVWIQGRSLFSATQQNLYKDKVGEPLHISHLNSDLVRDPELFYFHQEQNTYGAIT